MLIPYILTIIFVVLALLVATLLSWAAWRHRNPPLSTDPAQPTDIVGFGPTLTNRWLRGVRAVFFLLALGVIGFHMYWVFRAGSDRGGEFNRAKAFDARGRRMAESGLKGWILDRSGKLENALIRYRYDGAAISREYPLGAAAVHLTGYSDFVFGAGGLEAAYQEWLTEPVSTYNQLRSPEPVGQDLKVSIDAALQRETFNLIQSTGKPSAAVVLLLPNNEVLAMASAPSFEPRSIADESTWRRLTDQAENARLLSPLVNRATSTLVTGGASDFYRPGSTFKTFVASAAVDLGVTEERFTCRAEGFTPPGSNQAISDFGGEVHGTIGLRDAFRLSCNQYFAQLGLKIGKQRLNDYAHRLKFATNPSDRATRLTDLWQLSHGNSDQFNFIFAPPSPRMNLSANATSYDLALQSFGQGYDDLSVLSMALLASAVASPDGAFVAPTFEVGTQRKVIGPFISAQSAASMRELMKLVVESGTAAGAFAGLRGRISAGGKTGTADRDVPLLDRNGNRMLDYVDDVGRPHYKTTAWTDSWFIGFAPADNPQIAFAVLVENGGQGAKAAAPIAVRLIEKSAALGYLKRTEAPAATSSAPSRTRR
jgi:penicillin-binding protein A